MNEWIVLGSSPTASTFFPLIRGEGRTVITCLGALQLCPEPDYFFEIELDDQKSWQSMRDVQENTKAKIVTAAWRWEKYKNAHANEFGAWKPDIAVWMENWEPAYACEADPEGHIEWERGRYMWTNITGTMMLQFAVSEGADVVHVIGLEGYRSEGDNIVYDHFPGYQRSDGMGYNLGRKHMLKFQQPIIQAVVKAMPHVEFFFYGNLTYEIEGPNVTLVTDPKYRQDGLPWAGVTA